MNYEDILLRLAPCGLDCSRCFRFHDSEIKRLSIRLAELLDGFENSAPIVAGWLPQLKNYSQFADILDIFRQGDCHGCRYGDCPFPCQVKDCFKEKGADFCFQCGEYPCHNPPLTKKWRSINDAMKKLGVENYYEKQLRIPRYTVPQSE